MTSHDDKLTALLDPALERELGEMLRAAWSPSEVDPALNEALIEAALEDPLAPPTEEELVESERLRRALEGDGDHPDAELARVLAAAAGRGKTLAPGDAEQLAARATKHEKPSNVIYVVFGAAAAAAALAASAMLFVFPAAERGDSAAVSSGAAATTLAVSRSTAPLFDQKFEPGQTSQRVDRIAAARARELRRNRYAMWGVR